MLQKIFWSFFPNTPYCTVTALRIKQINRAVLQNVGPNVAALLMGYSNTDSNLNPNYDPHI